MQTTTKLPIVAFPYAALHLAAVLLSIFYLRINRNSLWVDFSLIAYPCIMLANGIATLLLKELGNSFYKATGVAFKILLVFFLPFIVLVLFF